MADAAKPMMGDRIALGVGMIIISTMCTATQDATFKFASSGMTIWQIFAIRSVFLIPILLIIAVLWGRSRGIWAAALSIWPVTRAIMFILMYVSMFSVIPFLNLAVVAAGLYTGPLWVALFSPLLMRERVSLLECIAICLGFCGILLNLRPGTDAFTWAALMPVLAGAFYALSAVITRSKCRNTEPLALSLALAVALLIMGLVCSLALLMMQPPAELVSKSEFLFGQWSGMGAAEWVVIGVLTTVLAINSVVLPIAYQSAKTVIVATFDYMYLVWSPLIGFAVFSEVPDTYTIIAMLMIAGAGLLILRAGK
jgi:drug/metabolite transporter (DMT)-like permease